MRKLPSLIVLGLLPLFVYPIFLGLAILSNIAIGDRSFIFGLTYDSLHKLQMAILTDWYASLPISYVIVVFILLPMHLVLQRLRFSSGAVLLLLASLCAWLFSYFLHDRDVGHTAVFICCGAILAGLFHISMWRARAIGSTNSL